MKIVVILKMVPDVVEELEIAEDGKSLDSEWLRTILSEPCGHALEQAVLMKEKHGATVTVVALEADEIDNELYNGLAKGADRVVKIRGDFTDLSSPTCANLLASIDELTADPETLIFTGSYAINDLEGELGPYIANRLSLPYVGVVTSVHPGESSDRVEVIKEFAGGLRGEFEVQLPAVLGIQSAETPPRYVPVSKVRAAMKEGGIEEKDPDGAGNGATALAIERMYKPETTDRAEMLEGSPEEVAEKLAGLLEEQGLL